MIRNVDRSSLLFNAVLIGLHGIFKVFQSVVNWSDVLSKIILRQPLICYRRTKNPEDHLVKKNSVRWRIEL